MSDFKNAAQKSFRQENGGVAVGLARGFVTSKLPKATRPSYRKGAKSQRIALVRSVCREVSGLSPYEKRLLDVLKVRVDAVLSSSVCVELVWGLLETPAVGGDRCLWRSVGERLYGRS